METGLLFRVVHGLGVGCDESFVYGPKGLNRGATVGVDALIYSTFSELKLPTPSSWGIFEEENKCFDQGTILLQGGEHGAREIIHFCAPVECPGAKEPTPWLPVVGIPFPPGFLLLWSLL